jgi:hypothetical protein
MSRSQWGGQRSNQKLGLPGWGYAVDLALTTLEWLIKENEDLKNSLTGENYESQQK